MYVKKDAQVNKKIKYDADKRNNAKPCNISIGDKFIVRIWQRNKILSNYDLNPYIVYSAKGNNMIVACLWSCNSQKQLVF